MPISSLLGNDWNLLFFIKLELQLKLMMNEITEFEKNLSYGLSFEVLIGHLGFQLADYVDEKDSNTFFARWDAWILDLPNDALDLDFLRDVKFKYVTLKETPADILLLHASCVYAVAAQRAHNRKDIDLAWALLLKAQQEFYRFDAINMPLLESKLKFDKSVQAAANGGITGQRVRYMVMALLYKKQPEVHPVGFPNIETAIYSIHTEMAAYVKRTGLKISLDNLDQTVKGWIKKDPAFRHELEGLFANNEIKD